MNYTFKIFLAYIEMLKGCDNDINYFLEECNLLNNISLNLSFIVRITVNAAASAEFKSLNII